MITRRTALILNFTAHVYHWGCYGTASEIYLTLQERGWLVSWLDMRSTHACRPCPASLDDFASPEFAKKFFESNRSLHHALTETDLVVVNGEGTLHGMKEGPRLLLYLMFLAQNVYRKPVHLVNHSFLPAKRDLPDAMADAFYARTASTLTTVVAREPESCRTLARLGIRHEQGFDCLPRFIRRHGFLPGSRADGALVLSGGIALPDQALPKIAQAVRRAAGDSRELIFLTGAKSLNAPEDRATFAALQRELPRLQWKEAASAEAWIETIRDAACLVSGRFHHSVAAMALGTPFVVFPSNTAKIEATCELVGLPSPIAYSDPQFAEKIEDAVRRALIGELAGTTAEMREQVLAWSGRNFTGL